MSLAYCDYIAFLTRNALRENDTENLLQAVSSVFFALDENGAFTSTTKTMLVTDKNGKHYKITVEEL